MCLTCGGLVDYDKCANIFILKIQCNSDGSVCKCHVLF